MNFKKSIALLMVFSILFLTAACGKDKKDDKKQPDNDPTESKKEVSFTPESNHIVGWIWSDSEEDIRVNGFIREFPEFTVDNTKTTGGVWGDKSTVLPNLAAAIAVDEQPDLFQSWIKPVEAYYSNLFMPVDDFVKNDPEYNVNDIDALAFESLKFNDTIYFVPMEYSAYIFSWNRDIFEDAGLDPDTPPKTWAEFTDFMKRTTIYNPSGSLKIIGTDQLYFRWDTWHIGATGEHYVDKTGLNFAWNTPEYVRTFEYIRDLQDAWGGNEKLGNIFWWFMGGNTAMAVWSGNSLHPVTKERDIGISEVPAYDENSEHYLANNIDAWLGIPKSAKNPRGAWKLLKYAMTDGAVAWELKNYEDNPVGYVSTYITHKPTRDKLYAAFEPLLDEFLLNRMKERDELLMNVNRTYFYTPIHNEMDKIFFENYQKVMKYELSPQDFMIQMQDYSDTAIKEFKKQKEAEGWVFEEGKDGIPPKTEK